MSDPSSPHRPEERSGLRIGHVAGVTPAKWQRIWVERYRRVPLRVSQVEEIRQLAVLDDGDVDMCFVRLPIRDDELHLIPLYLETPVVVAARDHPISLFPEVRRADLSEETAIDPRTADAVDLVAAGAGVMLVPQSVARSYSRRDLVYRPLSDGSPTRIGLAWRRDNPNEWIEPFIGIVRGRTVNSSRSTQAHPETAPPRRKR